MAGNQYKIMKLVFCILAIQNINLIKCSVTDEILCEPGSDCYKKLENIGQQKNLFNSMGKGLGVVPFTCPDDSPGCFSMTSTLPQLLEMKQMKTTDNPAAQNVYNPGYNIKYPTPRFGQVATLSMVKNYGCWCYDKSDDTQPGVINWTGFGKTVDAFDEACKAHAMGCDCIEKQFASETGEQCIPKQQLYTIEVTKDEHGAYCLKCANDADSQKCQFTTCLNDLQFITHHWTLRRKGIVPDLDQYSHTDNNFDVNAACKIPNNGNNNNNGPKKPGVDGEKRVCCGDYPYRVYYNENNNEGKECCEHTEDYLLDIFGYEIAVGGIYNQVTHQCCAEGVRPIGSC